jgi:hypothetical protein
MNQFALSNEGSSDRMGRDHLHCSKLRSKNNSAGKDKMQRDFLFHFLVKKVEG